MHYEMSFQVKALVDHHCCNRLRKNKRLTSKWLTRKYLNSFNITPNWRLVEFMDTIIHRHNYGISLFKYVKARMMALEMIYGKWWKEGCRPIISLDGCFLKVLTGGRLLAAIVGDGNNQIYPIACVAVEVEDTNSWSWFVSYVEGGLEYNWWSWLNGDVWLTKGILLYLVLPCSLFPY